MKFISTKAATMFGLTSAFVLTVSTGVLADADKNQLSIEGQTIVTEAAAPADSELEKLFSGWRFRSPETQALQADDFENPGMPFVDTGADIWNTVDGSEGKSCSSCHNEAEASMKGVRAEYPKWNAKLGKPHTLETQINECRETRMGAKEWKWESSDMLAKWHDLGKDLYYTRVGQLNMSCANCHEEQAGKKIRSDHLSQGQINGFPTYRLKWGGLGSTHRRFKGCMSNIRATPYKRGSDEFIALELYVASRGAGLSVETPAVRN